MSLNASVEEPNTQMLFYMAIFYRLSGCLSLLISLPLLFAILFHSAKTSRDYRSFLIAAQVFNIAHDICYNFSFAPIIDEQFHVIYSAGGLLTFLDVSICWQFAIVVFIRLQCAFCNFAALFYRHQLVQISGSRLKFSPWKCVFLAVSYDFFLNSIFVPIKLMSDDQGSWEDVVERELLPQGAWLLTKHSILVVPRSKDRFFDVAGMYSIVASVMTAVLFTTTAKMISKTLIDNRLMLSKSTKVQHSRAIAALRAQASAPLIFVTIPLNILIFSNSIIPRLHWVVYTLLLALPSFQSIIAAIITISFQASYRRFFESFWPFRKERVSVVLATSAHFAREKNSERMKSVQWKLCDKVVTAANRNGYANIIRVKSQTE